jgi:hypothetical protein
MKGGGKGDGATVAVARNAKRRNGRVKWCKSARANEEAAAKGSVLHRRGITGIEEGFLTSRTPFGMTGSGEW